MSSDPEVFGVLSDGREVVEYTLQNNSGIVVKILNYGGIVRVLKCPDRNGRTADIVLGFDSVKEYEVNLPYFGAIVGRVAGRISGGRLPVNGTVHQLPMNQGMNHLHGGNTGFSHRLWDASYSRQHNSLTLSYTSPDGEEGYPGQLLARVTYRLADSDDLTIEYHATADVATAVNMTQHSYFNLSGDPSKSINGHTMVISCDNVLELDENSIPTGGTLDVTDTALDFTQPKRVGSDCGVPGLDNYWILPKHDARRTLRLVAELNHENSGRMLRVETTAPGVQIYSGDNIPANLIGKRGVSYAPGAGICFETQVHPDSPNHPHFPGVILQPGEVYETSTVFKFRTG